MPGQRAHDGLRECVDLRHLRAVARREAAAEIDHAEVHPRIAKVGEQHPDAADRRLIGVGAGLLAADMERQPVRVQPELARAHHQLARGLDRRAELARKRPLGAVVLDQDAAVDARARRCAGELLQLLLRIEGEQRDARRMRAADGGRLLDRVAEADRLGARPRPKARLHLLEARGVEAAVETRPGAPARDAPGWPSRRSRCAPAAAHGAARGSSPPRGRRPAPSTALQAAARKGIGRSSGSSHRASLG